MKLLEVLAFVFLCHATFAWNIIPKSKFLIDVAAQFNRLNLVFHVPGGLGSNLVQMYHKELR